MGFAILVDHVLDFGKYKNKTILEVYNLDENYLNWILKNTEMLGGGDGYDFPFEDMKTYGYNPPQDVIDAYNKRDSNLLADMESERMDEQERAMIDDIEEDFRGEMGEEGYWNLD